MNDIYFPDLPTFYEKFCTAVVRSGKEQAFAAKWGLDTLSEVYHILADHVQGGFDSHRQSILSGPLRGSVLNVGPGMGFCVFLLSEIFDTVFAAEPDGENCALLEAISGHYLTHRNARAEEKVKIFHAGLSITPEAERYWEAKRRLMERRKVRGGILNFDIKGAGELGDIFGEKVSRVYLHKVLSSLSISTGFERTVSQCVAFLEPGGAVTWSEPDYIFGDILGAEGPDNRDLDSRLKPIFEANRLDFRVINYEVANPPGNPSENPTADNWTLIIANHREKK